MGLGRNIRLKKEYGQNFLRDRTITSAVVDAVALSDANVLEIGPGDGFLTRHILEHPVRQIKAFEIDHEWVAQLRETVSDTRLSVICQNVLDADFTVLQQDAPWVFLSNLPYHVAFPILRKVQQNRDLFCEGVVMVQEEVAQKLTRVRGKGYGAVSLFFQHYFSWKLLNKVFPESFTPQPKVCSRLLHFKPRVGIVPIVQEDDFWRFVKAAFHQPRRTLRNNLRQTHYSLEKIEERVLDLRAQQLGMEDLLSLWSQLRQV